MNPSMHNFTKLFLSAAFLTFFTAATHAQSFHAGLKAGANAFKLSGNSFDNKTRFGFAAGAYGDSILTRNGASSRNYCSASRLLKQPKILIPNSVVSVFRPCPSTM